MSRIIKFRAWDKEKKVMCFDVTQSPAYEDELWIDVGFGGEHGVLAKENFVLMQFSGLIDKRGKEIFSGDIVVKNGYLWFDKGKPNYRGTVEWIYSQWQVVQHCVNPEKCGISNGLNVGFNDEGMVEGCKSDWEVIGNVWESPELMKEGK